MYVCASGGLHFRKLQFPFIREPHWMAAAHTTWRLTRREKESVRRQQQGHANTITVPQEKPTAPLQQLKKYPSPRWLWPLSQQDTQTKAHGRESYMELNMKPNETWAGFSLDANLCSPTRSPTWNISLVRNKSTQVSMQRPSSQLTTFTNPWPKLWTELNNKLRVCWRLSLPSELRWTAHFVHPTDLHHNHVRCIDPRKVPNGLNSDKHIFYFIDQVSS